MSEATNQAMGGAAHASLGSAALPLPGDRSGRDVLGDFADAERREWLIANGIGGYASGTLAGLPTRGYHGLLVAALDPPVGRTVMLVTVLETVTHSAGAGTDEVELDSVCWRDGAVAPNGIVHMASVTFAGTTPTWRTGTGRFTLDKPVTMDEGALTSLASPTPTAVRITATGPCSTGPPAASGATSTVRSATASSTAPAATSGCCARTRSSRPLPGSAS